MSLHTDIKSQMIEAMKAKEAVKLSVIRGLLSSFTNELKKKPDEPARHGFAVGESGGELSDEDVLTVISRAVKQRKDSIEQFEKGGRNDLAESEKAELEILNTYLPTQMSREEIFEYVKKKLSDPTTPEATRSNKNQFIGFVMKELKSKADGMVVKEAVDSILPT